MAEETGIEKTIAGVTVAKEETPEALREQIKTLEKKVKLFNIYSNIVAPTLIALSMALAVGLVIYQGFEKKPNKIYSISEAYEGNSDLDGNKVPDLVLEQNDGSLIPFFGYKSYKRTRYVKSDDVYLLNPNPTVDYKCIDDKIGQLKIGKSLEEQGFDPTDVKCVKGGSDSK
ncbi:hypothetical protein HY636_00490 [Candidatus Woesearchaeota archaeon]|nr:hypothetical protein [Candidatus Woesearchaeota archaeon]